MAVREDSEKLSGRFLIHRQTGSEGVAGGGAKFLPTGQPRVTQPWLNRSLISCPVACHRVGRFMPIVNRRPRTKKKLPTGRPGWHPWSGHEGSSGILRMPPRGNELCRVPSVGFPSEVFYFPQYGGDDGKKKGCSRQPFWGPLWGPSLTEASFVPTMLFSNQFLFLPWYQQLHQDTRSALCRARHNSGHPML